MLSTSQARRIMTASEKKPEIKSEFTVIESIEFPSASELPACIIGYKWEMVSNDMFMLQGKSLADTPSLDTVVLFNKLTKRTYKLTAPNQDVQKVYIRPDETCLVITNKKVMIWDIKSDNPKIIDSIDLPECQMPSFSLTIKLSPSGDLCTIFNTYLDKMAIDDKLGLQVFINLKSKNGLAEVIVSGHSVDGLADICFTDDNSVYAATQSGSILLFTPNFESKRIDTVKVCTVPANDLRSLSICKLAVWPNKQLLAVELANPLAQHSSTSNIKIYHLSKILLTPRDSFQLNRTVESDSCLQISNGNSLIYRSKFRNPEHYAVYSYDPVARTRSLLTRSDSDLLKQMSAEQYSITPSGHFVLTSKTQAQIGTFKKLWTKQEAKQSIQSDEVLKDKLAQPLWNIVLDYATSACCFYVKHDLMPELAPPTVELSTHRT